MKKMNKKGFTLIELLAVIVILAIIMVIAVPQILSVINGSKKSAWTDNIKLIEKGIELHDSTLDVTPNAGTKVSTSAGCNKDNIETAADIDSSSTSLPATGTGSPSMTSNGCQFTVSPVSGGQFDISDNTAVTITCGSTGCSH